MIKVGVFNDANIPSHFAHSFNVMKMAQGFSSNDCEAQVVSCHSLDVIRRKNKYGDIQAHYGLSKPINIKWLMPSLLSWLNSRTQDNIAYAQRAVVYAKQQELDLVYARSFNVPILTAKAGIPTVVETHTTNYQSPMLQKLYQVATLPAFKGLVTIHEDIAAEHVARGVPQNKVMVLEDGVDLERFDIDDDKVKWRKELNLDARLKYVVYCGHLYADKGIEVIISLAEKLAHRQDIRFILAGGRDEDCVFWKKQCRKKKLTNILFTGFLKNAQVPAYLKAADCLILPYKTNMDFNVMDIHTTSPLKLFEYLAAARPILATDIPTVAKVLGDKGILVPQSDTDEFVRQIEIVLGDSAMAKSLGHEASVLAEQYSWAGRCEYILKHAI